MGIELGRDTVQHQHYLCEIWRNHCLASLYTADTRFFYIKPKLVECHQFVEKWKFRKCAHLNTQNMHGPWFNLTSNWSIEKPLNEKLQNAKTIQLMLRLFIHLLRENYKLTRSVINWHFYLFSLHLARRSFILFIFHLTTNCFKRSFGGQKYLHLAS